MSKEEFLKIRTCVLKVNIHCDGCKQKVKKILQKIEGVYTTKIDSEQGKVTVSGNVDPSMLIKKLIKNGKHAELWGVAPKVIHNGPPNNQFKNLQIDMGKGGTNKGHGGGGGGGGSGGGNNQPKGGGGQKQIKGFQDLKMPPQFMKDMKMPPQFMKDMKMPLPPVKDPKSVKFNLPEDDGMSDCDEEFDDEDDEFDDEDDDMDDVHPPVNKMLKLPVVGNMPNMLMNGNAAVAANGGNAKKGGGNVPVPIQINLGGADGKGTKKGGNWNQNHGAGGGGGGIGGNGGGQNKNVNNGNFNPNVAMNGGVMNNGPRGVMPNMMNMGGAGGGMGQMRNMPMGNMGNPPIGNISNQQMSHMGNPQMGQMSNLAAVQGLPASAMGAGAGAGAGPMPGNPYYQQQMAAMMMNQQHANGNERFQPMMYARPPPAVNYMPPYPPYPYPPPPGDRIDEYSMFNDENTSSCSMM